MRKAGVFLVAALAATACKNARESDQPSAARQVERAQEESKQAYDRAKAAQEKAIDEQQEANKALEKVNEKRQELAEAQAKADRAQQESQAAQEAAQREGQVAQQQAQEAQSRAVGLQQAQLQQQQAQVAAETQARANAQPQTRTMEPKPALNESMTFEKAAPSGTRSLTQGALDQASPDEIVIHREASEALRVKLDANTKVERNGVAANISDLSQGKNVTVTYRIDGTQPVAESVHIIE